MALFVLRWPFIIGIVSVQLVFFAWFFWAAYAIRLHPVKDFGYTIHEFDPWFNYRATEYLAEHGPSKFFKWYDYKSWYPIGRPIGTTIYPGMQLTAVAIWETMKVVPSVYFDLPVPQSFRTQVRKFRSQWQKRGLLHLPHLPERINFKWMNTFSVNDICVLMPAWFGSLASFFCGLLTYEVSRSVNAGICAVGIMAFIPAHLMRSVAGEFDNEAVAVTALLCTFWLWCRCVRTPSSWPFAIPASFAYVFMVATWGGYIFVINAIGVHALMLVALGRFNSGVYKAYTIFFFFGTAGATQIPVVGWTPLRSLEQVGPLGVFLGYQVLGYCDAQRRQRNMRTRDFVKFRISCFIALGVALAAAAVCLAPMGYFGPLSSRIRGLFVKHTKTGNPLVDSVAEHQPANQRMFASYLNLPLDYVMHGVFVCLLKRNNASYFISIYGFIAYHFSLKMSRLVLICGPIVSIMCALWLGFFLDMLVEPFLLLLGKNPTAALFPSPAEDSAPPSDQRSTPKAKAKASGNPARRVSSSSTWDEAWPLEEWDEEYRPGGIAQIKHTLKAWAYEKVFHQQGHVHGTQDVILRGKVFWNTAPKSIYARIALSVVLAFYVAMVSGLPDKSVKFLTHCESVARSMSNAMVMYKAQDNQGNQIIVDDWWKGYKWMAKNTPKDSRVMAWWDYGYQITGIGQRASLADGNTWNHEQIATIGKLLSSEQKKSHKIVRHLADYVMIMTGGTQDDLGISPHFARIGNSVFPDHCGDSDPYCSKFGFRGDRSDPLPMMRRSLVYNLFMHNTAPGVKADPNCFEMVYESPRNMMRIFQVVNVSQESKDWVADPANKICDAPGSWYCVGQYPPPIKKFIEKRKSFAQVEDFNKKGAKSAYTKMIEKQQKDGFSKEL